MEKVAHFIKREPPLKSYVKELEKLKNMNFSISNLPVHVPMHLFLLDCEELNQVKLCTFLALSFTFHVAKMVKN